LLGPCYQVTTADPERRKGKPYRLVIDVYPPDAKDMQVLPWLEGVRNHTIVLDAGHGGSDTGAVGPQGITEASVTLSLTKKLQKILEASGAHIAMTRTTDVDVYGPYATDQQELQARVDVGSRTPGTEVFLCIHCNAFSNPNARGMETYFYPKTAQDERLATDLHDALIQAESPYGIPDRGVKEARFYVMRHSVMPASLVEIAFITNPAEEQLLNDGKFQEDIALGLAKGLAKFFSGQ
jgi:N-acetylmuramoyl-L-alanine amidase